jgi:hypothetical protein
MNKSVLTLVYMLWLYQLYIVLYWISFFQLYIAYQVMIIVIWYSLNGPVNCNCSIDYQSISFFISNCSIELKEMQLLISCYMYSVNCSIGIQLKAIQLQLKKCNWWTVCVQLVRPPKVPPLQFFLQNRI